MYRFQLGELYERLPEGLNTIVSEKGMNFFLVARNNGLLSRA